MACSCNLQELQVVFCHSNYLASSGIFNYHKTRGLHVNQKTFQKSPHISNRVSSQFGKSLADFDFQLKIPGSSNGRSDPKSHFYQKRKKILTSPILLTSRVFMLPISCLQTIFLGISCLQTIFLGISCFLQQKNTWISLQIQTITSLNPSHIPQVSRSPPRPWN